MRSKRKNRIKNRKVCIGTFTIFRNTILRVTFFSASKKEDEQQNDEDGEETDSNTTQTCENLVDSSLPPVDRKQQRIAELQKMKANCKSEDLELLKSRCEILIRNCIVGLLAQLSDEDFKNMEGMSNDYNSNSKIT